MRAGGSADPCLAQDTGQGHPGCGDCPGWRIATPPTGARGTSQNRAAHLTGKGQTLRPPRAPRCEAHSQGSSGSKTCLNPTSQEGADAWGHGCSPGQTAGPSGPCAAPHGPWSEAGAAPWPWGSPLVLAGRASRALPHLMPASPAGPGARTWLLAGAVRLGSGRPALGSAGTR